MPAIFDHFGVRFQYPENWTLEIGDGADGKEMTVYSPGDAFWFLSIHDCGEEPWELMDVVLHAMREIYDQLDFEVVEDSIAGQRLGGYNVNFYCLDLTNTTHIRAFQRGAITYVMVWQGEDREFNARVPVFRAIATSLIEHR
jgi:hypothetical protein